MRFVNTGFFAFSVGVSVLNSNANDTLRIRRFLKGFPGCRKIANCYTVCLKIILLTCSLFEF